ncbi:alpha/beta hydrolase [Amycolatopsis sp. FU40]|uniref:alpha/beta hydrolase n=1 Tax=Amycolatopsis sp. FU40 TaxID=2914159 RepID=UPI001F37BA58|nr:alpha/beta hydrolase [Amycolatopsis sp. FU40]UKD58057.1 alpha/beta hydrolase [Amycolatopsis sp. FU40]
MRNDVSFPSNNLRIAAHLCLPDAPGPHPALVVGHPGTGVKEQTAGSYAELMAAHGYAALAFDAAYQGESEGLPRGLEDPAQRVEDFKAAVSYLTGREDIDPARIGLLGICASGGYSLTAASTDRRVRAVATVSAADVSRQLRLGADGTQDPAVFDAMLTASRTAPGGLPVFPANELEARAAGQHAYEGWEYYRTPRGAHPRSAKTLTWDSIDRLAFFDAFAPLSLLGPRPLLTIVGDRAETAWMSIEAFQRATGPKEMFRVPGASHVDLYDRPAAVGAAAEKLAEFFGKHL